jgi:hypothetical protein
VTAGPLSIVDSTAGLINCLKRSSEIACIIHHSMGLAFMFIIMIFMQKLKQYDEQKVLTNLEISLVIGGQ